MKEQDKEKQQTLRSRADLKAKELEDKAMEAELM